MNPVFNGEHNSFIWCYVASNNSIEIIDDNDIYSWSIIFKDKKDEGKFKAIFGQCMYETLNKENFIKLKERDRKYIIDTYENYDVQGEETFSSSSEEENQSDTDDIADRTKAEFGDKDEKNNNLLVSYRDNRSFVVRGSKIGVFKQNNHVKYNKNNQELLEFCTTINNIKDSKGSKIGPFNALMHNQDRDMIFMKQKDPFSLYKMDLELGKIVEEYNVNENIQTKDIFSTKKLSQMTGEPTILGISHNALYRIDPRLNTDNKIVETDLKQYVTKKEFSCACTTEDGRIAVGSASGEIRLFSKLGQNAKTWLPPLGDAIYGIDVTKNGRHIIATCKSYLLLIDTLITSDAKQPQSMGFDKSFPKDEKPLPIKLQLKPEHIVGMKQGVCFTPAKFDVSSNQDEKYIVTSTGPYIVMFNFNKVLKGKLYEYVLRKYDDNIVADKFTFNSNGGIVVTLPDDVNLTYKQEFKNPRYVIYQSPKV